MRKLAVLPVALVAAAVVAAPAAAQVPETIFKSSAKISPKKSGTKKNPRGVQLTGSLGFETVTQGVEAPIVTGGDVLIAKGGVWNGGKYAKCSKRTMNRSQSVDKCPTKSIVGAGSGVAFADTVNAAPDVVFVNGGRSMLWAFTTLYNPALVREPVPIRIRKTRGKWAYKASFRVPKVLQVVAGVPVTLRSFKYKIGGKVRLPYAVNGRRAINVKRTAPKLIATTSCPRNNRYPYEATAFYLYNTGQKASSTYKGRGACR
jgi:hypothetical protein